MRRLVAIDLRSLALYRILAGGLVLLDLVLRARNLTLHYTDEGPMPRELARFMVGRYSVSLFQLGDSTALAASVFLLTGLAAAGFALGWRTRLSNLVLWVGLLSIHNRNPAILDMGDSLLAMSLFWALFLPLGARWSLDSLGAPPVQTPSVSSLASFAFIFQFGLVYLCTGVQKNGPDWISDFTAIYTAIGNPIHKGALADPLMALMAAQPWVCYLLTALVLVWEYILLLLLLSPWRGWGLATVLIFQLGLQATLFLQLIPLINLTVACGCLPSGFWEFGRVAEWSRRLDQVLEDRLGRWGRGVRPDLDLAFWEKAVVVLVLLWTVLFATATLTGARLFPATARRLAAPLRFNNAWQMFGPSPPINGGYYHARGTLIDGRPVDLWNQTMEFEFKQQQPEFFEWRWMALCFRVYGGRRGTQAPLCEFLARRWALKYPMERLRKVELIYYAAKLAPFEVGPHQAMPVYTYEVELR